MLRNDLGYDPLRHGLSKVPRERLRCSVRFVHSCWTPIPASVGMAWCPKSLLSLQSDCSHFPVGFLVVLTVRVISVPSCQPKQKPPADFSCFCCLWIFLFLDILSGKFKPVQQPWTPISVSPPQQDHCSPAELQSSVLRPGNCPKTESPNWHGTHLTHSLMSDELYSCFWCEGKTETNCSVAAQSRPFCYIWMLFYFTSFGNWEPSLTFWLCSLHVANA